MSERPNVALACRFAALGGVAAGLLAAPFAGPGHPGTLFLVPAAAAMALTLGRPSSDGTRRDRWGVAAPMWLALVALTAACAGLLVGAARLAAIDGGALDGPVGRDAVVTGFVSAVPKRGRGEVRVEVDTQDGRVLVAAAEPVPELAVGSQVRARGDLTEPEPWRAPDLRRKGIATVLVAEGIEPMGPSRGGIAGRTDRIRRRAEAALGRGMPDYESALARGFVLGQDDRIDERTRDDFKRSGLAHLLAVSGQNVILLALLAWPLLAFAGLTLRARLICVLVLIAIYVPVTGAGASIQRAGVMGAAGVVAALAGRPSSRWYALLLAAAATLAVNPRASGDIGWQLSFAAVIGILMWSRRVADVLPGGREEGGWRRALAEGAAMTIAATLATAPLMAHHFDAFSVASLPANLLTLPAVAPAMWLGMLCAGAGQLAAFPVEPLNWVNSLLLAYTAQIARWFGEPWWALVPIRLESWISVAAAYAALAAAMRLALGWIERRRTASLRVGARRVAVACCVVAIGAPLATAVPPRVGGHPARDDASFYAVVLDVGQGDAILLDPPAGDPILVDGGPPGEGLRRKLGDLGVERLAAAIVTHDQSDHAGGVEEIIGAIPVGRLIYSRAGRELLGAAAAAGTPASRVAEGGEVDSGALRVTVLWPPRELLDAPLDDPNQRSLVLLAEWRHLSILLPGDTEAEAAPIDPGPVDVLKVAHHGSADDGLDPLLDRVLPRVAVISVGDDNPYGHPTPETLATLDEHGVRTLRTDEAGTVMIEGDGDGWRVE